MADNIKVPIVDLAREFRLYEKDLIKIFKTVGRSGQYVLGEAVSEFESSFASLCDTNHAVSCANASDGLEIALKAVGVGPGDEVITAANSFISSGGAIAALGAIPIFADIRDDLNIDPEAIEHNITKKTKAIMPVHLTGRPAPMDEILFLAQKYNLKVVEDSAQAVGASYKNQKVGSMGDIGVFSLHPLKNLHVYGDGGVITTNDPELNTFMVKYRNHGLRDRDNLEFWGKNSRLDSLQAKIASYKLKKIEKINDRFRQIAAEYQEQLGSYVTVPQDKPYEHSIYHNFVIISDERDLLMEHLIQSGVDVKIRYPIPLNLQGCMPKRGQAPNAERIARSMLSLPIFPTIEETEISYVIDKVKEFFK